MSAALKRRLRLVPIAAVAAFAVGCSAASAVWDVRPTGEGTPVLPALFVMPPVIDDGPNTGNVARRLPDVGRIVEARLLEIAREADPRARLADTMGATPFLPMMRYLDAIAPARATPSARRDDPPARPARSSAARREREVRESRPRHLQSIRGAAAG